MRSPHEKPLTLANSGTTLMYDQQMLRHTGLAIIALMNFLSDFSFMPLDISGDTPS